MTTRKESHSNEESQTNEESSGLQRLQRVMAAAGVAARRECELIIQEGRVEVDGKVVSTLGVKVDPVKQKIFVDGQRLAPERLQYFMLNKPPGVISTSNDPSGRARVIDLIKTDLRVYNVGRLDQSSEGLILVTNDGELANRLTHPRYGIEKKYHVQVDGVPTPEQLKSLVEGIYIDEGKAKATSAKILKKTEHKSWLEVVLSEGKNREIRRILAKIGHKVRVLKRVAIGPLKMGELPVGAHRQLTFQELKDLKRAAEGLVPKGKERRGPVSKKKKFPPRGPRPQANRPIGSVANSESKFQPKQDGRKSRPGAVLDFDAKSKNDKRGFRRDATRGAVASQNFETGEKGEKRFAKPERFPRPTRGKTSQGGPSPTSPVPSRQRSSDSGREADDDAVSSKVERFIPFDKVRSEKARPSRGRPAADQFEGTRPARSEDERPARSENTRPARGDARPPRSGDSRPSRSESARPARSENQRTEKRSDDRAPRGSDSRPGRRTETRRSGDSDRRPDARRREQFSAGGEPRSESRGDRRPKRESSGSQGQTRSSKKTTAKKSFGGKQVSQIRGSEPVKSRGQRPNDRNRSSSKGKGNSTRGRQR